MYEPVEKPHRRKAKFQQEGLPSIYARFIFQMLWKLSGFIMR
jgi:hypothetical protein